MGIPRTTQDIMATQVLTCTEQDTLATAHKLMRDHHIRHMPVVDSQSGEFLGLVTQKEVLRQAFTIAGTQGLAALEHAEARIPITQVMSRDAETVQPQLPLLTAGQYFLESKHGCLPVVVDGKLVTSRQPADLPAFMREMLRLLGNPSR